MHLGETSVTLKGEQVRVKFGMLFWKLILAHYGKEFNELGSLLKERMMDTEFMLYVLVYGHKAYSQLNKVEPVFDDVELIELANDNLEDPDWTKVLNCLLESKMMGKSWLDNALEVQKKTKTEVA